jgi:hypothetical protein
VKESDSLFALSGDENASPKIITATASIFRTLSFCTINPAKPNKMQRQERI